MTINKIILEGEHHMMQNYNDFYLTLDSKKNLTNYQVLIELSKIKSKKELKSILNIYLKII